MKKMLPFLICTFFSFSVIASSIHPNLPCTLFDHLTEVNKEWSAYHSTKVFDEIYRFENDNQRIQMHLRLVEKHLREHTPDGLDAQQIQNRKKALDILKGYYQNSIFPENHYHTVRQPYFIDNYGTACAVGYLVIETGFEALAKQISQENNYAYIRDLEPKYPALSGWAEEFGFSLAELAWIQPGYPPHEQSWSEVGNGGSIEGTINVMKAFGDEMLYLAGDFTAVDGVPANSIIGWDGNEWHTLGEGVDGTIHDLSIDAEGNVFIGGSFTLNGNLNIVNVAYWSDGQWNGFNTANMTGSVFSVETISDILYIGGAFELAYSNTIIENLAFVQIGNYNLENQNGDFSVDDIVYDLTRKGNQLLVAGNFSLTAPQSNNSSINTFQTKHLALWGNDPDIGTPNWIQAYDHEVGPSINSVFASNAKLYIGVNSDLQESLGIGILQDTTWTYDYCGKIDPDNNQVISGFLNHNGIILTYGNIQYVGQFVFIQSYGITVLENTTNLPANGAQFDAPVLAAESFQNQIYFAGEFTSVQGQDFPGLVSSAFDGVVLSTEETDLQDNLRIYSSPSQINVQYEALEEKFELEVYTLNGQLVKKTTLPSGTAELSITTQQWADGIYVYQAISKSGKMYSGKLSVVR